MLIYKYYRKENIINRKLVLLFPFILFPLIVFAQFTGGSYDGYSNSSIAADTLVTQLFTGGSSDGYASSSVAADQSLPVELSTFNATYSNEVLTINWTTATETNNAFWNIYRSISSNYGQAIWINQNEIIEGQGTTTTPTDYEYSDPYPTQANVTYWYWLESISLDGVSELSNPIMLEVHEEEEIDIPETPEDYGLHQNYPNPFNPNTKIRFALDYNSHIKLVIYNTKGQSVRTLADGNVMGELFYEYSWNGKDDNGNQVASGIYMYKLVTDQETFTKKMILMK